MPSILLLFNSLAFLMSSIEETPPDIITGQLEYQQPLAVSSKLGLCFIPSLLISV